MSDRDILVAKRAAYITVDGTTLLIRPGATIRAAHPMVQEYPDLFEPLRVQYDAPGEAKAKKPTVTAATKLPAQTETR